MKKYIVGLLIIIGLFLVSTLHLIFFDVLDKRVIIKKLSVKKLSAFAITGKLPNDLIWNNGSGEKVFASKEAKKGGRYNSFLLVFPNTFRQVGPESNSSFRSYFDAQDMQLVNQHPNTDKFYPALAKEWAIAKDKKTVYFRLDKDARWSDGIKVTADDYIFALKFYRSLSLLAPWYNDYFSRFFDEIIKIDEYTIGVRLNQIKPDLVYNCNISPIAYHFYGEMRIIKKTFPITDAYNLLKRDKKIISMEIEMKYKEFNKIIKPSKADIKKYELEIELEDVAKDFVDRYNWQVAPKTGAYILISYIKGEKVVFQRQKNWWAKDKKFFKNRYNPDYLIFSVIRDLNTAFDVFSKGDLDNFSMVLPSYWHIKAQKLFEWEHLGYMSRIWYYNDLPRPSYLLSMNMNKPLLKNINIRLGIAHSLNLKKMIRVALKNDYHQASTISMGYGKYTNGNLKARKFDVQLAQKYFKKAGFSKIGKDGILIKGKQRLSFEILYGFEGHTERLLILKNEALKVGLELRLQNIGGNASFTHMLAKKHELAWHGWSTGLRPSYWGQYHGKNSSRPNTNNFTNMNDDEINKLIDKYRNLTNSKERIELSKLIQQKIHNLSSAIPTIIVPYFREAYWNWLFYPKNLGKKVTSIIDNGLFWLNQKEKKYILEKKKKRKKIQRLEPAIKIINKR